MGVRFGHGGDATGEWVRGRQRVTRVESSSACASSRAPGAASRGAPLERCCGADGVAERETSARRAGDVRTLFGLPQVRRRCELARSASAASCPPAARAVLSVAASRYRLDAGHAPSRTRNTEVACKSKGNLKKAMDWGASLLPPQQVGVGSRRLLPVVSGKEVSFTTKMVGSRTKRVVSVRSVLPESGSGQTDESARVERGSSSKVQSTFGQGCRSLQVLAWGAVLRPPSAGAEDREEHPRRAPMSLQKWRRFGGSGRMQAGFRQRAGGEPSLGRVKACGGGRSRAGLRDCAHQSRVKPRSGSRETEG